ncbi:hypothetical protein F2Q69_00008394 [Brassica cretica]|uniref:Uncharacterized protein n=1 Tax=Brassica cretica TaxID=69181 RepID=A0A8S9NY72_BRACR|nr:hypothetical protein F2Q69_00008394 [Brassica cretica]
MSRHRLCISLPFWCAVLLTITGKRLTSFSCSSLPSSYLMLGTVSPWLGQSLVVFDVIFLVVGLPSIVSARLGFQDLVFGVLTSMLSFIARGRLDSLLISFRLHFPLYSCISLQLSSHLWWLSLSPCLPLEVWITFSFVYDMWAWNVILVSSLVFDFSVVVFHSPSLKLFLFFPCFP